MTTPAYPAVVLLFGMTYAFAAVHLLGMSWTSGITVIVFLLSSTWIVWLAWRRRACLRLLNIIDGLFFTFMCSVLASLILGGEITGGIKKFSPYLPFMMYVPYVCGRLMRLSDIDVFLRVVLIAGTTLLPFLLLDRLVSQKLMGERWAFFGQDHGALLVGALLAPALIALYVCALNDSKPKVSQYRFKQIVVYGLLWLTTAFLVWVSARGWLLAGLVGIALVSVAARRFSVWRRIRSWVAVLAVAGLSLQVLPNIDPQFGRLYSRAVDTSSGADFLLGEAKPVLGEAKPVLGEASCKPFMVSVNSVAMRWVLYQEAIAMFLEAPFMGVGAARFGEHSCTGPTGFPHSTILQGLSELGLVGGGLLIALLVCAAITLLRLALSVKAEPNWPANAFALALFGVFLLADQIYGNYFMSIGTYMFIGVAASLRTDAKPRASHA